MIECRDLSVSFGDKLIFTELNLTIPDGAVIGVFGQSGIGKSTLAKVLCGIVPTGTGSVALDGSIIAAAGARYDREKGKRIQMVYQQPYGALDHRQKLRAAFRELIAYHRFAPDRAAADALTAELLEKVGLSESILGHLPHQISGGEAQRVAIARSLLFDPRLLIMDEATSMLDVSTQANILALVRDTVKRDNTSVLFISHDRALVDSFCDEVHIFEDHHLT